jgi:beta-barrel assembly-enhancing protease
MPLSLLIRHLLRASLVASLGLVGPATTLHAQVNLPALGDSASEDFDITAERRLGERIMRDIRRDPDFLDDPLLQEYLDGLWQPLLAAARARGNIGEDIGTSYAWQAFLVRDRAVNAFALPGGYVGVYLGLIGLTATRDELASVLAHELTHVTQRHIARSMVNSQRQGTAAMAAMILGVLAASRAGSADAAQAVIMGSQAAMAQGQLNFSREMEREADRIGFDLLGRAGFAGAGMSAMFEKLEGATRLNDNNQYPYLRSHPLTIERISEARLRLREGGVTVSGDEPARHALMQARARVLMNRGEQGLRQQQAQALPGSPAIDLARLSALYSSAMASIQLRDFDRADQALAAGAALAAGPFARQPSAARAFALLKLDSLTARGGTAVTAVSMDAALAPLAGDRSRVALLARAQAALARHRAGDPTAPAALRTSTEALQTWVTEQKQDGAVWLALSQCAEPLGLRLRALRAGAESALAGGDLLGAADRFRVAQEVARQPGQGDDLEALIIQARLRDIEPDRRRLLAEMRGEKPE